jgi:hypothetical protein
MKRIITILVFAMFFEIAGAPPNQTICIVQSESIKVFDKMLYSFMKVESNFDTDTINRLGYGGILQIGTEMIAEANRICRIRHISKSFTLTDRLDSIKSVQVWYIVQNYWNPSYTLEKASKIWNPKASNKYYKKLKTILHERRTI